MISRLTGMFAFCKYSSFLEANSNIYCHMLANKLTHQNYIYISDEIQKHSYNSTTDLWIMPCPRITPIQSVNIEITSKKLTFIQDSNHSLAFSPSFVLGKFHTCDQVTCTAGTQKQTVVLDEIAWHCYCFSIGNADNKKCLVVAGKNLEERRFTEKHRREWRELIRYCLSIG